MSTRARTALTAIGAAFAVFLLAGGGLALWADGRRDRDGYFATAAHRVTTPSRALDTPELPLHVAPFDRVARLRFTVTPGSGKPLFIGIARAGDVSAYLRGVAHTTVRDFSSSPFRPDLRLHRGERRPSPPGSLGIWAASSEGAGPRSVAWDVRDGDWAVVVMNADGSEGVDARVRSGVRVTFLDELGIALLGLGLALGAITAVFARRPAL